MKGSRSLVLIFLFVLNFCVQGQADSSNENRFTQLSDSFKQKAQMALGSEAVQASGSLSVFVAKKAIAEAAGKAVNLAGVAVTADVAEKPINDVKNLELKLTSFIKDCEIVKCHGCDQDCGLFDVGCHLEKGWCQVQREVCLLSKAAVEIPCKAAKAITDELAKLNITIAEFELKDMKARGTLVTTPINVQITEDLSKTMAKASINANILVSGVIKPHIKVIPGLVTGCSPIQPDIQIPPTNVQLQTQEINLFSSFEAEDTASQGTDLNIKLEKAELKVTTSIKPFLQVIRSTWHLKMTCLVAAISADILTIVDQFFPINISSSQSFSVGAVVKVGQITIRNMPTRPEGVLLTPVNNAKSLGVIERAPIL